MHLLLRRSVADIATRIPDFLRPSLTARDIAAASSIPTRPRAAFSEIARIVEAALFARRPVGAEGWRQARGAYERFAFRDALGMSAATTEAVQEPFSRRTLFWGIFASLLAAAGFFLLSTYAADFRQPEGGATPFSKGGTGYAGLVEWLKLTNGQAPPMERGEKDLESPLASTFLLVVTIAPGSDPAALDRLIKLRSGKDTLFVLPKWQTMPLLGREGWETKIERLPNSVVNDWLGRIAKAKLGEGKPTVDTIDVRGRQHRRAGTSCNGWRMIAR
ncbi:DUF4129 domain-containing protein [Mesorhizobium atlanticum]